MATRDGKTGSICFEIEIMLVDNNITETIPHVSYGRPRSEGSILWVGLMGTVPPRYIGYPLCKVHHFTSHQIFVEDE